MEAQTPSVAVAGVGMCTLAGAGNKHMHGLVAVMVVTHMKRVG